MNFFKITLFLAAFAIIGGPAYAKDNVVLKSYDATYDRNSSDQKNCDDLILGSSPDVFKSFEPDGTIKVRLTVEEDYSGHQITVLYVNEKAFLDYFTKEVIPINPPQLSELFLANSILPKLRSLDKWVLWNRTGYVRRPTQRIENDDVFATSELLQLSATNDDPGPSEVIDLRSSELVVTDGKIDLKVDKLFKNSNPHVVSWLKGAEWVESRNCTFEIVN